MKATHRIDGSPVPASLLARINAEEGVGTGITAKTRQEYARKVRVLTKRIEASGRGPLTPEALADCLAEIIERGDVSQATFRSYRSAAIEWLKEQGRLRIDLGRDIDALTAAHDRIDAMRSSLLPLRTQRTSGTKLKFFPEKHLRLVTDYVERNPNSMHAGVLLAFVRANLLIGLRPQEWFSAAQVYRLFTDERGVFLPGTNTPLAYQLSMTVANAKTTAGRANGATREIILTGATGEQLCDILEFHKLVYGHLHAELAKGRSNFSTDELIQEIAKDFFAPLQRTLRSIFRAARVAVGDRPSLYSTRHQAVANAKSSGYTNREIAALFGHISTRTARMHYGKKTNGWMKMTFRASEESIAAVRAPRAPQPAPRPTPALIEGYRTLADGQMPAR